MDVIGFKYQPEFIIRVRIDGQDAGDQVQLMPSPSASESFNNSGLIMKATPGIITGYVRQNYNGTNWVPAVDLTEPRVFSFWAIIRLGTNFKPIHFFGSGNQVFGKRVFYVNNLSGSGAIDSHPTGNVVSLTPAGQDERGSLCPYLLSVKINPGAYSLLKAGKIEAGSPVSYSISKTIDSKQTSVELDVRSLPKGAYAVKLQGSIPVEEHVIFDQKALLSDVNGIIDIYKDAWQLSSQPREYRIDFSTT